jgi:hypothetical protein
VCYQYVDGILVESSTRTWRQMDVLPGQTASFFVTDDANEVPGVGLPAYAIVTWDESGDDETARYEVEQYIGGAWLLTGTVMDVGEPWFRWVSGVLEDGAEVEIRVKAVDGHGVPGAVMEVSVLMVRVPDRLDVSAIWNDETGVATVSWE